MAISLMRLQNHLLTISVLIIVAIAVYFLKSEGPWSDSFYWALKLILFVIAFRVFIGVVIGVPVPGRTLFYLPEIPLPSWMAGITLGGAVTWERVSSTIAESLNIATIIALFGGATSLTNPRALLRSIPHIFYEVGMVLVIATNLTPQLVANTKRIRIAQQSRGVNKGRLMSWRQIAMPLLEDSLARALDLAAAMDSRGYGLKRRRSRYRPHGFRAIDLLLISTAFFMLVVSL